MSNSGFPSLLYAKVSKDFVGDIFIHEYHRSETKADLQRIEKINSEIGFSEMIGSLDCTPIYVGRTARDSRLDNLLKRKKIQLWYLKPPLRMICGYGMLFWISCKSQIHYSKEVIWLINSI